MEPAVKTTVLLVDDDAHFRETLADAMSFKEVQVDCATTCADALKRLEGSLPAQILLDVQLPDMHGFEFCRALKRSERLRSIPVVFLSAKYTEPADRAEGLLAGAEAYLSKPMNLETLWDEMRYLLDKPR